MNSADTTHGKTCFSIRSLLSLMAVAAIVFVVWKQHRQNRHFQRRLESLSSQVEHLNACDSEMRAKLEQLIELGQYGPVLRVPLTPTNTNDDETGR